MGCEVIEALTVLGLEISMEDHGLARVTGRLRIRAQSHDTWTSIRRGLSKVAAVQCADDLAEDAPYKLLLAHLVVVLEVADHTTQVTVPAVFHVQVQILGRLDVVSLEVGDDVWVSEFLEDRKLGLQLFALLW